MRTALITGASSGIGATFAKHLSARGYELILVARRRAQLEAVSKTLSTRSQVVEADLTVPEDLDRVAGLCGDVELLVNNAGFGTKGFFHKADLQGQMDMHKLHVLAPVRLSHAALPGMLQRNAGGIINVSSVAAFISGPGNTSYCATKAWMNMFTQGLDLELRHLGSAVKVQALCPGYTYSAFHDVMRVDRNSIPKSFWMTADFVVQRSLWGFDRGDLFVVPGWKYSAFSKLAPLLPSSIKRAMASVAAKRSARIQ